MTPKATAGGFRRTEGRAQTQKVCCPGRRRSKILLPGSCCWIQSVFAVAGPPPDDHQERRVCRNSWHQKGKFHDPRQSIDRASSYGEQTRKQDEAGQECSRGWGLVACGSAEGIGWTFPWQRLRDTRMDTPTQTCPAHDSASRRLHHLLKLLLGGVEDVPLYLQHGSDSIAPGPKLKAHFRWRAERDKHLVNTPTGQEC